VDTHNGHGSRRMHHQKRHVSCLSQQQTPPTQLNRNLRRTRAHTSPTRHNPTEHTGHSPPSARQQVRARSRAQWEPAASPAATASSSATPTSPHNGHPRQKQWARKAPPVTTASTHTDADTHHIGTTGAVGAQGITSHGSIRSSQRSRLHSTAPQCTPARQHQCQWEPVASPAATASD
jgi:hypothetical protein